MKKFASLILALAMCFGLAAPAFATESATLSTSLEQMLPELAMTLPEETTIYLNPYRMSYTGSDATGISSGDRYQIMNTVFSVISATTSKVQVTATVSGAVSGNAEFATSAVAPGDTGHSVYLTLTYAMGTSAVAPEADSATSPSNVITISDSEQTKVWDLPAATTGTGAVSQYINMQFGGSCSDSPAENPWAASDTVSASVVFEVIPVTDIPMVPAVYQNATTAPNLEFTTFAPSDANATAATAAYAVSEVRVGASHAEAIAATALSDIEGSTWTNGTAVMIPAAKISGSMGNTNATKYVVVTLTYKDNQSTPVTKTIQYEAKVTVKAAS